MQKLSNIQILRAVAAMMVVIYHCGMEMTEIGHATGRTLFFDHDPWGTGVALFFAISGFIMVATSYDSFGKPGASLDFARRRLIRIVPLYWLMTTVAVVGAFLLPQLQKVPVLDTGYIAASYLFWPAARVNGLVRPIATPGWTLNLEMMFYTVFAVALLFPRRFGLGFALAALGGLTAAQALGAFSGETGMAVVFRFWGDPIITGFLFGMLVGIVHQRGLRMSGWLAAGVSALGLGLLLHTRFQGFAEDHVLVRLGDSLPAALVVLAAAIGPQVDGRRLVWRLPMLVGDASYSLYLTHEFALRPLRGLWLRFVGEAMPLWTFLVVGIALALTVGFAGYLLFERPVTRWLNRSGRRPAARLDRLAPRLGAKAAV